MEQNKLILLNEDLLLDNLDKYANKDLEYINVPNSVGIATECNNNKKIYIIYLNNEIGHNIYNETTNSFLKAVIIARKRYKSLITILNKGITIEYCKRTKTR